jgi:hypothetical protein
MLLRTTVKHAALIKRGVTLAMTQATLAAKLGYSEAGFIRAKKAGLPRDVVEALKRYVADPLMFEALPKRPTGRPRKTEGRSAPKGTGS